MTTDKVLTVNVVTLFNKCQKDLHPIENRTQITIRGMKFFLTLNLIVRSLIQTDNCIFFLKQNRPEYISIWELHIVLLLSLSLRVFLPILIYLFISYLLFCVTHQYCLNTVKLANNISLNYIFSLQNYNNLFTKDSNYTIKYYKFIFIIPVSNRNNFKFVINLHLK